MAWAFARHIRHDLGKRGQGMTRGGEDGGPMRRFFAFPLVRMVLIVALLFAAIASLTAIEHVLGRPNRAIEGWLTVALLLAAILLVERLTVRAGPNDIGFDPRNLARDVLFGIGAGAVLFSAVILELTAAGAYHIVATHVSIALLYAAAWVVPAAILEELLFRGVIFRLLAEWSGTWIALGVSSALFGLAHTFNPGATWVSTMAIALEAGVLLGAAFIATRSLWAPIGLHFAWNFFEGPVYGTNLSGLAIGRPLFDAHVTGPAWLTGGAFGPEASVPAIVTCSAAAVAILIYAYRTGSIVACPWFRSKTPLATAGNKGVPQ
jgi:uncharacterized protein